MASSTLQLSEQSQALVALGRGILAVDETPGTLTSRFQTLGITSTPDSRRDYRELLFRTPGLSGFITGVILNDETLRQQAADGTPMAALVAQCGLVPGIKVDRGLQPLAGAPGESVTEGLDGLRTRLQEYRDLGARFTKWRAVFTVDDRLPTTACIEANAHALARYAALVQEAGMVPMVESEVLMDGGHSIDRCQAVTEAVLRAVFAQLAAQGVHLEAMVLKPNMVVSGLAATDRAGNLEVAQRTLASLRRTVPAAVPGVAFLSGGQADAEASLNLNTINQLGVASGAPWQLSFSFARALQRAPMAAWAGRPENVVQAQQALWQRASVTHAARTGAYAPPADAAGGRR